MEINKIKLGIIGLGYVGLPLAIEFGKKGMDVIGFDINPERIRELEKGIDRTREMDLFDFPKSHNLKFSENKEDLADRNVFIVTVPTPIDEYKKPNLIPLITACEMIGSILKKGDHVIFESTVYPGCTEEVCVPQLEKQSSLKFNYDFYCGYSPERINPGDKSRPLPAILKITSGSTEFAAEFVDKLYQSIITAGTYKAKSIKVAEAAKAIENAQRDVNISFVNELALIFDRLDIDTNDVIEAAGTKWNFLKFRPGLVGGHCIGVDPYYLAYKAESVGYHPQVILSGRRVNDLMGMFVAGKVIKLMIKKGIDVKNSRALILGFTFKENCPDVRNTRVIDMVNELHSYGVLTDVYDPIADAVEVLADYGIELIDNITARYDTIIFAVSHDVFKSIDFNQVRKAGGCVIYDVKGVLDRNLIDGRL